MALRIAINGFGRIGRCILRALYERGLNGQLQVVAINEPADCATMGYMLRYDSTHGRFQGEVSVAEDAMQVNGDHIAISHHTDITQLDWAAHNIDLVLECSGLYTTRDEVALHLSRGAKRVLLSQPGDSDMDFTLIHGLNQADLDVSQRIVSNGSCSTNCVLPLLALLDAEFGIEQGVTTTIHSAMNDQPVIDAYHSDLRRTRAAVTSIIPVDTALPKGIARLLPQLEGRFESLHLRVPTLNVSAMDLSIQLRRATTAQQLNALLQAQSKGPLKGILGYTDEPHASVDFNHDPRSGIVDASQTRVSNGQLVKLLVWFDNEWGFANRMLDTALLMAHR